MTDTAYKLADRAEWEAARAAGAYQGSAVDRADGYIHMSTAEQLAETARRHYRGRADLVLATVDLTGLGSSLRWGASRGGAMFPHLHGDLPMAAVREVRSLDVDDQGIMRFTEGDASWA